MLYLDSTKGTLEDTLASDPRVHAPVGVVGQKVKI